MTPVLFWVQHLLGSGHLKRAATLARAISERGLRVVIASGGTPAPWLVDGVELVQLPPVRASDLAFTSLLDEHDRPIDDRFRALRRDRLLALFQELRPRAIITEMFPFGRRAFRFELSPLLEAAACARPRPWRLCSVRDVLVRKPDPEGYAWMLAQARAHFDRILAHTDPQLIPFGLHLPARRGAWRSSGRDRLRDRAAHGANRRAARAKCWSPPAAAGSAQDCSRWLSRRALCRACASAPGA